MRQERGVSDPHPPRVLYCFERKGIRRKGFCKNIKGKELGFAGFSRERLGSRRQKGKGLGAIWAPEAADAFELLSLNNTENVSMLIIMKSRKM